MRAALVRLAFAACALLAATPLTAQGTAPVPLDDPAYVYLDRLEELGVMNSAIMGQRPYSFREMGRLTRDARAVAETRAIQGAERGVVEALLDRLEGRIAAQPDTRAALFDEGLVTLNGTNAARRRLPPAGTAFSPEATIDPMAKRRLGEPALPGQTVALELLQRGEPTPWFAFQARERFEIRNPRETDVASSHASVLRGSLRARWRNVAFMAGREQAGWGSGGEGGLFFAADAPALDQISLASDHSFLLPWVLRRVGPVAGTFILAEMGPSVVRTHSKLLAYKLSARPTFSLELGASFQNHFGGRGGRSSPFLHRVIDFIPIIDIFRRHNYVDTTRVFDVDSDKVIGIDARWRIDRLGGVIVAGEWLMDDFDAKRLSSVFNYAASHTLAVTVPRLGSPAMSLRMDATHIGPLTYNHATLRQGITTRGRLLGSEFGPDSKSFAAELRWSPTATTRLALEGRSSIHSNSAYQAGYDINGRWVVRKLFAAADELRDVAIGSLAVEPSMSTLITVRAGVGRTRNALFTGNRLHSYVADIALRWRP